MPVCFLEEFIAVVITIRGGGWQEAEWLGDSISLSPIRSPEASLGCVKKELGAQGEGQLLRLMQICTSHRLYRL